MLKLKGKRPTQLGVSAGRFNAPDSWKPNWVSSQVDGADAHYIAPLKFTRDRKAVMARLQKIVAAQARANIISAEEHYLYAEFSTPLMGFVDDVEFCCAEKHIHVRSASRLGVRDFDVNRKRVEKLRAEFEKNS